MVNVKKHEKLKKKTPYKRDIMAFDMWLKEEAFKDSKVAYTNYWGGINGAIHRKLDNWNPDNEEWTERNGLMYAKSNNEIVLPNSIFTVAFPKITSDILLESTEKFLLDLDIGLAFKIIDATDYVSETFEVFKLIDESKKYDLIFFKNMDLELWHFLIDYGISKCVNYIYVFFDKESTKRLFKIKSKNGLVNTNDFQLKVKPKFLKEGKIGFDLYQNLTEWKKEVTAPTRNDPEYRRMKIRVRERDDFTCQCCGYRNTKKVNHGLEVHHIYGYKDHLDYRTEDSNCVTLCNDCHKKYHSVYGKNDVTPITFSKFIRDYNTYTNKSIQSTLD